MPDKSTGHEHTKRDAESLWALGTFLVILSIPVFIGTFFEEEAFAQTVNVIAGAAILVIGALMIWRGIWTRRHLG
jgi:ABC-type nickel/cobalt efflux system permease component RcnA